MLWRDRERSGMNDNVDSVVLCRRRFLQQLRSIPAWQARNLLQIETPDELVALRDACFPEGDEATRGIIQQELDAQDAPGEGRGTPRTLDPVVGGLDRVWVRVQGFVRLAIGWRRMRWGHCPACNDDAPECDRCLVCNYFRFLRDARQPKTLWNFKQAVWLRFRRWVDDPENVDKANAGLHRTSEAQHNERG